MKAEIIAELGRNENRLLLHEEKVEDGQFRVVSVWENVTPDLIETSLDVFNSIRDEGYKVDYIRIPITDEQGKL